MYLCRTSLYKILDKVSMGKIAAGDLWYKLLERDPIALYEIFGQDRCTRSLWEISWQDPRDLIMISAQAL